MEDQSMQRRRMGKDEKYPNEWRTAHNDPS
jgi:hypothetical protein